MFLMKDEFISTCHPIVPSTKLYDAQAAGIGV